MTQPTLTPEEIVRRRREPSAPTGTLTPEEIVRERRQAESPEGIVLSRRQETPADFNIQDFLQERQAIREGDQIPVDLQPRVIPNRLQEGLSDLATPADPNTLLGSTPELRTVETGLDLLNLAALSTKSLGGAARARPGVNRHDFNRNVGRFESLGTAEQIALGLIVDPLNLIPGVGVVGGLGRRAATGVALRTQNLGRIAEPLVEGVTRGITRTERPLARLVEAENIVRSRRTLPPEQNVTQSVSKLTDLIKSAKPVNVETAALRSAELGRRSALAGERLSAGTGQEAFTSARSAFAGELPKGSFTPPELGFTPNEITGLHEAIRGSSKFGSGDSRILTRINTDEALTKLLTGEQIQDNQIALLENMFGEDLAKAILGKQSLGKRTGRIALDIINLPRAVITSYDVSAPLRQGAILTAGHPVKGGDTFLTMMRALAKETTARRVDDTIRAQERFPLFENAGLFIAERQGVSRARLAGEEVYTSNLARNIPGVRASERAYTTYLNKLRFDVMNGVYQGWLDDVAKGGKAITDDNLKLLAQFVNAASGRGRLPRAMTRGLPGNLLNIGFFSPRFQASRVDVFVTYAQAILKGNTRVRKEITRDLVSFFSTNIAVLSMLSLSGLADVEMNPLSSDFGKIRIRGTDTRIEFWAGMQPYARYMAQIMLNKQKSARTGETRDLSTLNQFGQVRSARTQRETTFTEREISPRIEQALRFGRSKLGPPGSLAVDVGTGEDFVGRKFGESDDFLSGIGIEAEIPGALSETYKRTFPLFGQDVLEAMEDQGLLGGFMAAPGAFGAGVTTFEDKEEASGRSRPRLIPGISR